MHRSISRQWKIAKQFGSDERKIYDINGFLQHMCNDTNNFLFALRRLSPPPPANSPTAETAVGSDTLTEAGYARSNDEN